MNAKRLDKQARAAAPLVPGDLAAARLFFLSISVLAIAALPQLFERGKLSGQALATYSLQWLALLGITSALALVGMAVAILLQTEAQQALARRAAAFRQRVGRSRLIIGLVFLAAWVLYVLIVLYRYQKHFEDFLPQVWLFFLAAGIGAYFLSALWKKPSFFWALLLTALLYGAGVKALGFLPEISAYPFSLSWSEGSRFYYASLPFARSLFGMDIPLSSLHPTRYLLQGLAFLAPDAGIAFHRFWQVALWVSLSLLAGLTLARRFRSEKPAVILGLTAWAALFLLQGPVYYHLLVCVALVLGGFDRARFWKTMIFVVLGSLWAGISRVNWIPVPAMLAATLYLLEEPFCASKVRLGKSSSSGWYSDYARYLWRPFAWGVAGCAAALAAQASYVLLSGHEDVSQFGSSFTSALLWYRLIPSPTFPMGVIPATLLVTAPMLVLIIANWRIGRAYWHPLRVFGISVMALVLLAGGLVVSTKIGGGSNLHNLDAFFVLLLVIGGVMGMGHFGSETGGWPRVWRPWPLVLLVVLVPVVWNLNIGDPFVKRDFAQADYDLGKLNGYVQEYAAKGEVLFITQRQLEVFDLVPGVRMVPDYELMTLTEMSMANNEAYLNRFYKDLHSHRFSLIVADRQQMVIKNPVLDAFAEENNAWVTNVSQYILKDYYEEMYFDTQGIQLLVPKQ